MSKRGKGKDTDTLATPLLGGQDLESRPIGRMKSLLSQIDDGTELEVYIKDDDQVSRYLRSAFKIWLRLYCPQDYHSDSAIGTGVERRSLKHAMPVESQRVSRVKPPDGPSVDSKHKPRHGAKRMAKMESQRERKARKKNIARSQQVLNQVQLFRFVLTMWNTCLTIRASEMQVIHPLP
jgi:hypothetical protein